MFAWTLRCWKGKVLARPRSKKRQSNSSAERLWSRVGHSDAVEEQPEKREVTTVQTKRTFTHFHAAVGEKCSTRLAIEYPDFVRLWSRGLLCGDVGSVRGVKCWVRKPHEGLMAMVGIWVWVWFVWRSARHVHPSTAKRERDRTAAASQMDDGFLTKGKI